jgi:peptidoglycan/LPS O-acetylase OafA/YrhL
MSSARKIYNGNLDILRAMAASIVVFQHISTYSSDFDKQYSINKLFLYNQPAHMAVLMFFILSGYVIGLNHPVMKSGKEIGDYIWKRLVRLVPIFFVVVLSAVIVLQIKVDLKILLTNLFFVSVPFDTVIIDVSPIWSLNYEIFYYFLFVIFAYFNINLLRTVFILFAIVFIAFLLFHNVNIPPITISYFIGFIFWISGAMIARIKNSNEWILKNSRIISLVLLIFCLQYFNLFGPVLKLVHLPLFDYSAYTWFQQSISWNDLFFYPLTLVILNSLTRTSVKLNIAFVIFTFVTAYLRLIMLIKVYGFHYLIQENYQIPTIALLLSTFFWLMNRNIGGFIKKGIKSFAPVSKISYALYLVHLPMLMFFGRMWQAPSFAGYFLKLIVFFAAVGLVSWLLEVKFQGLMNKLLKKKRVPVPVVE